MKKCVNTRARAFKITNTKKETPTYRRRAPPRPLPLRSVPPVFNQSARVLFDKRERDFCVSERVQLLKPRERREKIYEFLCNNPSSERARVFAGTELIETRIYIRCSRSKIILESASFVPRPRFLPLSRWPFFIKCVLCDEKRALCLFLANLEALFLCV